MPFTKLQKVALAFPEPLTRRLAESVNAIIDRLGRTPEYSRTPAETTAGVTPVNYRFMPTPIRDISRYVSDNTGATDVLSEFQNAIDVEKNELIVPDGTYLLDGSLNPKSGTGIFGNGQSTLLKLADGADVPVIAFASDDLDYVDVHLRGFVIDGNKANQTSTDARGIYLTNSGGTSSLLARHRLSDIYIHDTKGDALYLGFAMRSSHFQNIEIYKCDGAGVNLAAHSDSVFDGFIIGQSGMQGVIVNSCGPVQLSNFKVWFSGRLGNGASGVVGTGTGGTNGAGYWIRNSSGFQGVNLQSQENYGHGLHAFGSGSALIGVLLTNYQGDGDNQAAGTFHSIQLDNVQYARVTGRVGKLSTTLGTPVNGVNLSSTVTDSIIEVTSSGQSGKAVDGAGVGSNEVRVNGDRFHFVRLEDDFLGDVLADHWGGLAGTDTEALAPAINSQFGGVVRLQLGNDPTGSMATNGSQLHSDLNWQVNAHGVAIEFRLKLSAITDVAVFIGFTDQIASLEMPFTLGSSDALTSNATDAVGVLFDTGADTDNWWLVGVKNDTDATAQDSDEAPTAGTYERWRIVIENTGSATFFRNGTLVGETMADAISANVRLTPVVAGFARGSLSRNIDVDFIRVQALRG